MFAVNLSSKELISTTDNFTKGLIYDKIYKKRSLNEPISYRTSNNFE